MDRLKIIRTAAHGKCPRCGCKDLFASRFELKKNCPQCQLPLEQEDGWGLGAIPLNYSLTCLGWILPIGILFLFSLIPIQVALILAGLGALIVPILTYPYSKKLWIGIYYAVLPHEMKPENQADKDSITYK